MPHSLFQPLCSVYLLQQHTYIQKSKSIFVFPPFPSFSSYYFIFGRNATFDCLTNYIYCSRGTVPWRFHSPTKAPPPDHLQSLKFIYNHFHDNFFFGVINSSNFFLPSIFVFRLFFFVPFLSLLFNFPIPYPIPWKRIFPLFYSHLPFFIDFLKFWAKIENAYVIVLSICL